MLYSIEEILPEAEVALRSDPWSRYYHVFEREGNKWRDWYGTYSPVRAHALASLSASRIVGGLR